MIILSLSGTIFHALFTLLLEFVESKKLNAYAIGLVLYSLINIRVVSFFTIGMNYACEIKDKKWITNVFLLCLFVISIIFVFLFDVKLDRQEIEQAGRLKDKEEENEDKKISTQTVQINGNET